MPETFQTRHGTTVAVMVDATTLQPSDLGALLAFHHWRDFMRGHTSEARYDPDGVRSYFPAGEAQEWAHLAYRRHWRDSRFVETTR